MPNTQLKVLVAIDHNLFADGLSRMLSDVKGVTVCKVVNCGNQLVEDYGMVQPDVAIVDLNIPNLNGIQATRKIMQQFPKAKIIILSLYINTSLIKQLKHSGIKGYVENSCDFESLVETIRKVSEGNKTFNRKELVPPPVDPMNEYNLTSREIEILKWLAEGYTNGEIASRLYISVQTVDTHRKRLIDKLGVRNSVEMVSKAVREGLIIWSSCLMVLESCNFLFI